MSKDDLGSDDTDPTTESSSEQLSEDPTSDEIGDDRSEVPLDLSGGAASDLPEEFFHQIFGEFADGAEGDAEAGREAFVDWIVNEIGVNLDTNHSGGRATDDNPSTFVVLCGGGGGVRSGTNDVVALYNGDLMGASRRARSFRFDYSSLVEQTNFVFLDSENIRSDVQRAAPEDAPTFKRTLLDSYRPFAEGGAGRSPYQMSTWVLNNQEDLLEAILQYLNNDGYSIEIVQGFLGGGTGAGLVLVVSELARQDLVGTGPGMLGAAISTGEFLLENDEVNAIRGMPPRQTVHDEMDILRRLGEDVESGALDFVSYATNWSLALHGFFDYENYSLQDIRNFYAPLRERRDLVDIGYDYRFDPEITPYIAHGVMNESWSLTQFPFLLMGYRPVDVEFRRGRERWDLADAQGVLEGHFWSKGFAGVSEFQTLADRVDECPSPENRYDLLDGATRLAANKLASDVTFDDIDKALTLVFAPEWNLDRAHLHVVEDAVEDEYGFDSARTSTARELGGLEADRVPGAPKLAVWVLAAHDAPLDSKAAMFDENFLEIMPAGGWKE